MENEKLVIDAVTVLANKLGTTGTHLWEVLVRQAPISCTINLTIFIIFTLLAISGWIVGVKLLIASDETKTCEARDLYGNSAVGIMLLSFIISMFIIFRSVYLPVWISGFYNPEYWALQHVIETFN